MTVSELFAVSTNENWEEMFIQESRRCIYKLMKLGCFSGMFYIWLVVIHNTRGTVYFDTDLKQKSIIPNESKDIEGIISAFKAQIPSENNEPITNKQFILKPISGLAKVAINTLPSNNTPKISAKVEFDEFALQLDNEQFRDINHLLAYFQQLSRSRNYLHLRPPHSLPVSGNARVYWNFAIKAIREEIHDRRVKWTWKYMMDRQKMRRQYIGLWKDKRMGKLGEANVLMLKKIERKLQVEEILLFRSLADAKLRKELSNTQSANTSTQSSSTQSTQSSSWYSWWYGTAAADQQQKQQSQGGLSDAQLKELYNAIDYVEGEQIEPITLDTSVSV